MSQKRQPAATWWTVITCLRRGSLLPPGGLLLHVSEEAACCHLVDCYYMSKKRQPAATWWTVITCVRRDSLLPPGGLLLTSCMSQMRQPADSVGCLPSMLMLVSFRMVSTSPWSETSSTATPCSVCIVSFKKINMDTVLYGHFQKIAQLFAKEINMFFLEFIEPLQLYIKRFQKKKCHGL